MIAILLYTRLPPVFPKLPGSIWSNSYNSSGYEQTLCENNMQLTELQLYINNIARCIGILGLLSAARKIQHCYNLIKCPTIFTSRLSTNHNIIQQAADLQAEKYTSPYTLFLVMSHSIITQSGSTGKLTIYIYATTIPSSPSPFVSKYYLDKELHSISVQLKILVQLGEKRQDLGEKQLEE